MLFFLLNIVRAIFTCRKKTSEISWTFANPPCADLDAVSGLVWPEAQIFERQGTKCVLNGGDPKDLLVLQNCPISSQTLSGPLKLEVKLRVPCHENVTAGADSSVVISLFNDYQLKLQGGMLYVYEETWQESQLLFGDILGDLYGEDNFHLIEFDVQSSETLVSYNGGLVQTYETGSSSGNLDLSSTGDSDFFISVLLQDNSCTVACDPTYDCFGRGTLSQNSGSDTGTCMCTCTLDQSSGWSEDNCEEPLYLPVETYATCNGDVISVSQGESFEICAQSCIVDSSDNCAYFNYDAQSGGRCIRYSNCILTHGSLTVYQMYSSEVNNCVHAQTPIRWMAASSLESDVLHMYVQVPLCFDIENINFDGTSSTCASLHTTSSACQTPYWESFVMGHLMIYHAAFPWRDIMAESTNYLGLSPSSNEFTGRIVFHVIEEKSFANIVLDDRSEPYPFLFYIVISTLINLEVSYDPVVRGIDSCDRLVCGFCQKCDDLERICVPDPRQNGIPCVNYNGTHNAVCNSGECIGEDLCGHCSPCEECVIQGFYPPTASPHGFCIADPTKDGIECDDGMSFTHPDRCHVGRCIGTVDSSIMSTCTCERDPRSFCQALAPGCSCPQRECTDQPVCVLGYCDQRGTQSPTCDGGYCDQTDATNPSCNGGSCIQNNAIFPTCDGGWCHQQVALRPYCSKKCDQTEAIEPVCTESCLQIDSLFPLCHSICQGNCNFINCGGCFRCTNGRCLSTPPYVTGKRCELNGGGYGVCKIDGECHEPTSCEEMNPCEHGGVCESPLECICPPGTFANFCQRERTCTIDLADYPIANGLVSKPIPFLYGRRAVAVCQLGFEPATNASLLCVASSPVGILVGNVSMCIPANQTHDYITPLIDTASSTCDDCPAGGCDQTQCVNPLCTGGYCDHSYTRHAQCPGGFCTQVGSFESTCTGGWCHQNFSISPTCNEGCIQTGAINPYCYHECTGRCDNMQDEVPLCHKCQYGQILLDKAMIGKRCGSDTQFEVDRICTPEGECVGTAGPCGIDNVCRPCELCQIVGGQTQCTADDSVGGCAACSECSGGICSWFQYLYDMPCSDGDPQTLHDVCKSKENCKGDRCGSHCEAGGCEQMSSAFAKPCCEGGHCNQQASIYPMCPGGYCDQNDANKPECDGGHCDQAGAVEPKCRGGNCIQTYATNPSCDGGGCIGNCNMIRCEPCESCSGGTCGADPALDGTICENILLAGGLGSCANGICDGSSAGCESLQCGQCQSCHLGMCVPSTEDETPCQSLFYPNPTCQQGNCIQESIAPSEIGNIQFTKAWQETVDIRTKLTRINLEGTFTIPADWTMLSIVNVTSQITTTGDATFASTSISDCGQQSCIMVFHMKFTANALCIENVYEILFHFDTGREMESATFFVLMSPAEECALVGTGRIPSIQIALYGDESYAEAKTSPTLR